MLYASASVAEEETVEEAAPQAPSTPIDAARLVEGTTAVEDPESRETVFEVESLTARYGSNVAISDVSMKIHGNIVTAVIGPSGCGKSTFIRCLNRMNDLVPGFRADGRILYHGQDLQASGIDPVAVRRRIAAPPEIDIDA